MISTTSHPRQIDLSFWADETGEMCRLKMMELQLLHGRADLFRALEQVSPDLDRYWAESMKALRQSIYQVGITAIGFVAVFILSLTLDRPPITWAISLGILLPLFFAAPWAKDRTRRKIRERYSFVVEI